MKQLAKQFFGGFRVPLLLDQRVQLGPPAMTQRFGWILGVLVLHILLGVLCKQSRWIATLHAVGTLTLGLHLAFRSRDLCRHACWGAYAVAAEILWRLSRAALPYEFGKYAVSLVLLVALVRSRPSRVPLAPILYFLLLVPAILPVLLQMPLGESRMQISFNLSGPFCLAICAIFFSRVRLDDGQMQRLMIWLMFPVASLAAAILFGLSTTQGLEFGSGSNFATSGGFGPNQVSSILGLGALYALLLLMDFRLAMKTRLLLLGLALWFSAHAALSFSRTGVYLFAAGFLVAVPLLPLRKFLRPRTVVILCVAFLAGLAAWSYLVNFTGGKISERFAETDLSGREQIASGDLQAWKENPLLGVGVGMMRWERARITGTAVAAHTEYTRLLSEHGTLGLLAGICILSIAMRCFTGGVSGLTKAVLAAGVCWALLSMAVSAMRTAAPGFLIGLAYAQGMAATRQRITTAKRLRWGAIKPRWPAITAAQAERPLAVAAHDPAKA